MSARRAAARRDLRAALKSRKVNRKPYNIVVGDGDLPALNAALDRAEQQLAALEMAARRSADDPDAVIHSMLDAARQTAAEAQAAVKAQVFEQVFEALPGPEFEAIRLAHPVPAEDEPEPKLWSRVPALAAACAVDSDLTEAEWAVEIGGRGKKGDKDYQPAMPGADYKQLSDLLHELHRDPANAALAGKASGTTR